MNKQVLKLKKRLVNFGLKFLKINFDSSTANDGTTLYYDGELEQGTEVWIMLDDGSFDFPPDGDYKINGNTYIVENGVVLEKRSDSDEDMKDEEKEKMEAEDLNDAVSEDDFEDLKDVVETLVNGLESLGEQLTTQVEMLSALKVEFEAAKKPAAKSHDEVRTDGNDNDHKISIQEKFWNKGNKQIKK
jgi:hypothetical protein